MVSCAPSSALQCLPAEVLIRIFLMLGTPKASAQLLKVSFFLYSNILVKNNCICSDDDVCFTRYSNNTTCCIVITCVVKRVFCCCSFLSSSKNNIATSPQRNNATKEIFIPKYHTDSYTLKEKKKHAHTTLFMHIQYRSDIS
jgi:hypothetical protein